MWLMAASLFPTLHMVASRRCAGLACSVAREVRSLVARAVECHGPPAGLVALRVGWTPSCRPQVTW